MLAMAVGSIFALALIPVGYLNGGIAGAAVVLFVAECVVLLGSWVFARRCLFTLPMEVAVEKGASLSVVPDATR
jgi:hypothetical protein